MLKIEKQIAKNVHSSVKLLNQSIICQCSNKNNMLHVFSN